MKRYGSDGGNGVEISELEGSGGRRRVLVVTDKGVYPPIGGASIRNWQNISLLRDIVEVVVFVVAPPGSEPGVCPPGIECWEECRIGDPGPGKEWFMRFWWARPYGNRWADSLYDDKVSVEMARMIVEQRPDVVVLEQIWLHRYLPIMRKAGCPIIYDAHNCEADLAHQMAKVARPGLAQAVRWFRASKVGAIERRVVNASRQLWACSCGDGEAFRRRFGSSLDVQVIPNGLDVNQYQSVRKQKGVPAGSGIKLVFAGTFNYRPNIEAADWLINEILPILRDRLPDCELSLVGANPSPRLKRAGREVRGLRVTGRVPDVLPYLAEADIAVVPLISGGGTRLKILEAFAAGLPVISTRKGAEGIDVIDGKHLLVRDTTAGFIEAILKLQRNPGLRQKLSSNALELVKQRYSWESIFPALNSAVEILFKSGR